MITNATSERPERASKHVVRITPAAYRAYKESIAANPPETFALIGGSLDEPMLITDFHFMAPRRDENGRFVVSRGFVYPDHEHVNYIIDNVLVRKGHYMLGLWHSHPGRLNMPSGPDLDFCSRILANDDSEGRRWNCFIAPITTFDDQGRDTVTAWVLPKAGRRFEPAGFAVEQNPAAEMPVQETVCAPRLPAEDTTGPLNVLAKAREFMGELERDPNSLRLIQAYQISCGLARMAAIAETARLLRIDREKAVSRRTVARKGIRR